MAALFRVCRLVAGRGFGLKWSALEPALAGALQTQFPAGSERIGWNAGLQARRFAVPSGSGKAADGPEQEGQQAAGQLQPGSEAQAASGKSPSDPQRPAAEQPARRTEQPGVAAAAGEEQPAAAEQQAPAAASNRISSSNVSSELPSFGEEHPELKKYIEQLKLLKGSSTVQRSEVGGEPAWWQKLLSETVGNWMQNSLSNLIRAQVETEFDEKDFLEGAKDAFHMVHELMAEEDWESLKPMMSAKLYSAFKDTADAYKVDGLVWRTALHTEQWKANIRGLGFMNKQQMEAYDPALASLAPDTVPLSVAPSGAFMVVIVHFTGLRQLVTISRQEDGQVVAELTDTRPVRWKFATGPLPGGLPVDQLGTHWFLLSI